MTTIVSQDSEPGAPIIGHVIFLSCSPGTKHASEATAQRTVALANDESHVRELSLLGLLRKHKGELNKVCLQYTG